MEKHFRVVMNNQDMKAFIALKPHIDAVEENLFFTVDDWKQFLHQKQVRFGIQFSALEKLAQQTEEIEYPLLIASGVEPQNGADGEIQYKVQFEKEINREENWDFREVMKIPSVKKGDDLATIIKPTVGQNGRNVKNEIVKAKPGKPAMYRAGKNVTYSEENLVFYAEESGQFNLVGKRLQIFPEYEVNETLSLKNGNLDFVGTIIIRGDVPTGFTVKAGGDVKIFGLVESATIIAGGSIYVTEGISGQGKGLLEAGKDIKTGYINQAQVNAGQDLYVENSILHSDCIVHGDVYCQQGNIIGGSISAGKTIEARDIGTRWNTKTDIVFGVNKSMIKKEEKLIEKKLELKDLLAKLKLLGDKLKEQDSTNPKIKVSRLRQQNSYEKTKLQLNELNQQLNELNVAIGDISECKLVVRNFIYQNVHVSFGKYKRNLKQDYHYIRMNLEGNEIALHQLYD